MASSHSVIHELHILYVEDNPGDVQLVRAAFAPHVEAHLHVVDNGVQAFEFLAHRGRWFDAPRPDLVLLDLSLPVISGYEVLREIEHDPLWHEVPVVVLTSSARPQDIDESYRCGAVRHLHKPSLWDRYPK